MSTKRYWIPNSKAYHTEIRCPKLNHKSSVNMPEEMPEDVDFTQLKKCCWCKNRDKSGDHPHLSQALTQLSRYSRGEKIVTDTQIIVRVRNQPSLIVNKQTGEWCLK